MVGCGETYFLANAVRLGASPLEQGLVVTLPLCVGAVGAVLSIAMLAQVARRKAVVCAAAALQIVTLAAVAVTDALGTLDPTTLIALSCVYHAGGQAAGTAWSSWYGDLVPARIRGRFFARRNRVVHGVTLVAILGAGASLHWLEPGAAGDVAAGAGGGGYLVIFTIAAAARLVSVVVLAMSPEPRFAGLPGTTRTLGFLKTARGTLAWRLLLIGAGIQFVVYFASPYFGPFMLEGLRFTYLEYTIATVSVVLAKILALPAWGRVVDRHGARSTYALAAVLVGIVPLPWLWAEGLGWVVIGQALSGLSWAGYEISFLSSLLFASTKRTRPYVFAAQTLLNGSMQLLGGLIGAAMLAAAHREFRVVFAVSLCARLALGALVSRVVPRDAGEQGRGLQLLRVIGFRAHGGLVHRPVDDALDPEPDAG